MYDRNGRPYLTKEKAAAGLKVELDGGFTCRAAEVTTLLEDKGGLYFKCKNGKHYLDGQLDTWPEGAVYTGVYHLTS